MRDGPRLHEFGSWVGDTGEHLRGLGLGTANSLLRKHRGVVEAGDGTGEAEAELHRHLGHTPLAAATAAALDAAFRIEPLI